MKTMKPEIIRYQHIRNLSEKIYLELIGKKLFGDKFLGFVREITFIHSEDFITKKIEPIEGTPSKEFREAVKRTGLVGFKFEEVNKEDIEGENK